MWQCPKCRKQVDDGFEVCWSCGTSNAGVEDPDFRRADEIAPAEMDSAIAAIPTPSADESTAIQEAARPEHGKRSLPDNAPLACLRCHRHLEFVGTKSFHEGFQWGIFGDLAELFVNKEAFDLYVCRRCGHVEFFITGLGEEFRRGKMGAPET